MPGIKGNQKIKINVPSAFITLSCFLIFAWTQERNVAAVKIQLVVRSFLQRRRAKKHNQAAIIIQSLWRGHVARERLRQEKKAQMRALQNEAATVIQVGVYYLMKRAVNKV